MYANIKLRITFLTSLLLSYFGTLSLLQAQTPSAQQTTNGLGSAAKATATPILSFTLPTGGTVTTDGNVTATLHLTGNADPSTLRVMLNKTDVTSWFTASGCSSVPCDITAHLNVSAGVSQGWDLLQATLKGTTGNAGIANARFYYRNGVSNSTNSYVSPRIANAANSQVSAHANATLGTSSDPLAVLPHAVPIKLDSMGFTLGNMTYLCTNSPSYTMLTVDRTTLVITNQQCLFPDQMQDMISGYFPTLTKNDIVFLYSASGAALG